MFSGGRTPLTPLYQGGSAFSLIREADSISLSNENAAPPRSGRLCKSKAALSWQRFRRILSGGMQAPQANSRLLASLTASARGKKRDQGATAAAGGFGLGLMRTSGVFLHLRRTQTDNSLLISVLKLFYFFFRKACHFADKADVRLRLKHI